MNLLLNNSNIVVVAGSYNYNIQPVQVDVNDANNSLLFTITSMNNTNATSVTVADTLVPANVVRNYTFVNGQFIAIDSAMPDVVELADLLLIDIPKVPTSSSPTAKATKIFNIWKSLLKSNYSITSQVDPDFAAGIFLTNTPDTSLTATQVTQKKKALNVFQKLVSRFTFEIEIGDLPDQVADLDKQLQLITPMVVRVYLALMHIINSLPNGTTLLSDLNTSGVLPTALIPSYDNFANSYVGSIQGGTYKDRIDVADPSIVIPKILSRNTTKASIAQTYQNSLIP